MTHRVAVIGAGAVGAAVARELTKYDELQVHLLEKEADVGWGTSKANTGIIHAGYDDEAERYPLRAKLCRIGNVLWHELAECLQVPVEWCGALVLALDEHERRSLAALLSRGKVNGVPGLEVLSRDLCIERERNLADGIVEGLWAPTSGVISPYEAVMALAENAVENGARLHLETIVSRIVVRDGKVTGVETDGGFLDADIVVNAAGIFGDRISSTAGISDFRIRPRRGEYFVFDRGMKPTVGTTLFPAPQPTTKGVVVTPTPERNLLVGPNARDLEDGERDATMTTRDGLDEVWEGASRLVVSLPPRRSAIRTFAGLRPEPDRGDFIVRAYDDPFGLVNCVGMRSPGLTSAPAVAKEVIRFLMNRDIGLTPRRDWDANRKAITKFRSLLAGERDRLISDDPRYGDIICTCEMVTAAEVDEAIRRGAATFDSVKFRTRAGMGRCQGSFCTAKVMIALSKGAEKPLDSITLKGRGSNIVQGHIS